ncbi:MAG: hypothetical protein JRG85_11335 [Deltaproteobacteria bacterium]|nr:hypothetical protein [Deltaproteobacteria bacterium]
MLGRTLAAAALSLTLATPALAGSKPIVTPGLIPPSDGALGCEVVNASTTKPLEVNIRIVKPDGTTASFLGGVLVAPYTRAIRESTNDEARHCMVEVVSGKAKDARVTIWVKNASGKLIAAVAGPSK